MKWLRAKVYLGIAGAWQYMTRPFSWLFRRNQEKRFLSYYREDGIIRLTSEDRALMQNFSGCINCGLCDLQCIHFTREKKPRFMGPRLIAVSACKWPREFPQLLDAANMCLECEGCSVNCPYDISIPEIVHFMNRASKQLSNNPEVNDRL
jgi:succinate dehydrogenase/fumarate reductase-like Fe-S protein